MAKRLRLPIRSLGSEVEDPALERLATWVADHRGQEGDLLTYKLDESFRCQEGIDIPAVGGLIYGTRISEAFSGPEGECLPGELFLYPQQLVADATRILTLQNGLWFSIPAPHLLPIRALQRVNDEEQSSSIISGYQQIMRVMRDAGVAGHVLLCDQVLEEEIEQLTGGRQLMYCETADVQSLSLLLEYQTKVAIPARRYDLVLAVREEFDISQVILVDPDTAHLTKALEEFDPDSIAVGGYCRKSCEQYWTPLIRKAEVTLSSPQP